MVSRLLTIVATVGVVAAASGSASVSAFAYALSGEVKANVSLPPGHQRAHHRFIPVQAIVSVTIIPESGGTILHEMIFTNTNMVIWVPAGRYTVSAEIGPPTVNPRPKKCGEAHVAVGKKTQANFTLRCPLR